MSMIKSSVVFLCVLATLVIPAMSISCYQCNNTSGEHMFQCNEFLTDDIDMEPKPCDDVYGAQYCVKHVGRYEALGIKCYQCTAAENWTCHESIVLLDAHKPESCEHVYGAQHCIKTTQRYGGGFGTKRFCSSKHLGDQCYYVRQPGDTLEYRTCVYTCSTDGCNPGTRNTASLACISLVMISLFYLFSR